MKPANITILNESGRNIPEKVEKALSFRRGIGSAPNKVQVISPMENLFQHWEGYAQLQSLALFNIQDCKAELLVWYEKLMKCRSDKEKVHT